MSLCPCSVGQLVHGVNPIDVILVVCEWEALGGVPRRTDAVIRLDVRMWTYLDTSPNAAPNTDTRFDLLVPI